jgi:hypothetical protein
MWIGWMVVCCLFVLCAGCKHSIQQGVQSMKNQDRAWGQPVEGCRLSISVPASKIEAGRPVELTLVFRNDGPTEMKFPKFSMWFNYEYAILYDENQEVPLTPFGEHQKESSVMSAMAASDVAPGEELTSTVEISRLYDLSRPGKYTVEASKDLPSRSGQGFIKVVSNRLDFEIIKTQ